jgi:hypothetical protein
MDEARRTGRRVPSTEATTPSSTASRTSSVAGRFSYRGCRFSRVANAVLTMRTWPAAAVKSWMMPPMTPER